LLAWFNRFPYILLRDSDDLKAQIELLNALSGISEKSATGRAVLESSWEYGK
jgi:hypothetical protein